MRPQSARLGGPGARTESKRRTSRRGSEHDSTAVFSRQVEALRELYERSTTLDRDADASKP